MTCYKNFVYSGKETEYKSCINLEVNFWLLESPGVWQVWRVVTKDISCNLLQKSGTSESYIGPST